MNRPRLIAITCVALLLALPASALAQTSNPFGGLPPVQSTPAPTPTPTPSASSTGDTGRTTLYLIGAALAITFVAIGTWIARDARRSLPAGVRESERLREDGPHRQEREAKAKARAKGRAQRQARKTRARKAKQRSR
jgi:hypothetical protein